ncbi:hypothetical protein Hanom_Chr17g01540091 [Helianthus anomalus]
MLTYESHEKMVFLYVNRSLYIHTPTQTNKPSCCKTLHFSPNLSLTGQLQKLRFSAAHPLYELQMQHFLPLQLSPSASLLSLLLLSP